MASSKRCILLTGAPEWEALSWTERDLLSAFEPSIKRFLGDSRVPSTSQPADSAPTAPPSKWRAVANVASWAGGREQVGAAEGQNLAQTQFLASQFYDAATQPEDRDDFLEHSMALFVGHDSNTFIAPEQSMCLFEDTRDNIHNHTTLSSQSLSTSFGSSSPFDSSAAPTRHAAQGSLARPLVDPRFFATAVDLDRLPSADHLARIQPQTVTVNLLVGLIAVSPTRTVQLRRRNGTMDIIELTLGDDTRAGFSISFWLPPADSQQSVADEYRDMLTHLRSGDVLLIRNVALSSFRGCVYGQSLNRSVSRTWTMATKVDEGAPDRLPVAAGRKVRRVVEWTDNFVGVPRRRVSFDGESEFSQERTELPPDTP